MSGEIDPNWLPPDAVDPFWAPPEPSAASGTAPNPVKATTGPGWHNRNSGWVAAIAGFVGVLAGALLVLGIVSRTHQPDPGVAPPSLPAASSPPSQPTPVAAATPPNASVPPPPRQATQLEPNSGGFVTIVTSSGKTKCQIEPDSVLCEAWYTDSPIIEGEHADGTRVTADGQFKWWVGNLGNDTGTRLGYQTYRALGWTIDASFEGTRFTNDRTGHGMFVSMEKVYSF